MRSRLITNLLLLLAAIILGLFLFIDDIDKNDTKKLSTVSADSINQISIYHKQREVLLKKIDSTWYLIKPVEITANQFRIKTLLNILNADSHAQYNADSIDLKKFALDKAETYIEFNDTRINFGISNPINNYRYVKIDNTLHLIDDLFYPLLSSQTGTLVARELLPATTQVTKIVLPEHTLARDENGIWKSDKNILSDAIVETIYQWQHLQAFAVHNYMAREPLGEIMVYLDNSKTPIHFTITDVEPWLIIARPDINMEYHFNIEQYDALLRPGSSKTMPEEIINKQDSKTLQVSPDDFMNAIQQ